ncbi:MAG: hypothetical protein M3P27_11665 [Acidobacteriota bacterium]|nr:hypothetical protein [Acidobacteriota bacterium]
MKLAILFWRHPLSFFLFVVLGGGLLFLGVVVDLHALVSFREQESVAPKQG